ncbi:MAG: 1-acyl-sn-glycerol-3-phosphate acyltransferase [Bermanella sp.]|nr:1-acyl-sn-glycerol-3-phosphate acyltransferase [Bermanella sp.]|tara:strand:- start:239 stop:952 length:714 start_codon:yes stop_codon:yes gene_type:complete
MIRLLRFCLLAIHFVFTSTLGLLIGILRPFHPTNSRWCSHLYGKIGLPIIGIKTQVEGLEHFDRNQPCVVVCNHQSNWDLFVVGSIVPKRTVSVGKKSLKWVPLFGQLYWLAGNVLIDRGNPRKAMEAMDITKDALTAKNTSIWFFAEGTRNKGKNMLPFKKGAFVTAINAGVPIVPVACSSYLKGFDMNNWDNGTAKLRVLPAVSTKGCSQENVKELMDRIHADMMNTINELDASQ